MINQLQLSPLSKWNITYSTYVDNLQVFKKSVYSKNDEELINKRFSKYTIVCDKKTLEPILIEMKQASKSIGELDNMAKKDIIKAIEGYINDRR
jgi:hypothetical protein